MLLIAIAREVYPAQAAAKSGPRQSSSIPSSLPLGTWSGAGNSGVRGVGGLFGSCNGPARYPLDFAI